MFFFYLLYLCELMRGMAIDFVLHAFCSNTFTQTAQNVHVYTTRTLIHSSYHFPPTFKYTMLYTSCPLHNYMYIYSFSKVHIHVYLSLHREKYKCEPINPSHMGDPSVQSLTHGGIPVSQSLTHGGIPVSQSLTHGGIQCPSPLHMGGSQCPSPLHMGGSQCLAIRQSLTHGDPSVQPLDSPLHMGDPSVQPLDSPLHMGGSQCPAIRQSLTHGGIPVSSH